MNKFTFIIVLLFCCQQYVCQSNQVTYALNFIHTWTCQSLTNVFFFNNNINENHFIVILIILVILYFLSLESNHHM